MSNHEIGLSGIKSEEKVRMGDEIRTKKQSLPISMKEEISNVLVNQVTERHSYFQLRYFLIGKEPTNQSKMWQCLRELKIRKESIDSIELEYEDQKDKLELLDIEEKLMILREDNDKTKSNNELNELKEKEIKIKIRKIKRQKSLVISTMAGLLNKKKYIEEESHFFLEMFKTIQKTEPLSPFDDVEAQKQYWSERLSQKLNLRMLSGGQLDSDLVETIMALPDDMTLKKQVLNNLNVRMNQIVKKIEEDKKEINGN